MENSVIYQVTMVRLCIDELKDGEEISGYVCGVAVEEDVPFKNRQDLMMKICDIYDTIGQPQAFQVMRSFRDDAPEYNSYVGTPVRYHDSAYIDARKGKVRTIDLIMKSRKHAEWQGLLKDIDGNIINRFNSMLEMIRNLQ